MAAELELVSTTIEGNKDSLRTLSQELWSHPELAFEEFTAHRLLTDYLEKQGFIVDKEYCDLKTAFRARSVD